MEAFLLTALKDFGYIILFFWCMMEGEIALIMGGILSHTGDMYLPLAIFIAAIGGFIGDQVYFYIGRFNKRNIQKKLKKQRRKFAIAYILLNKYGWPLIFLQRYMYGLRTVIPMAIGTTRYSARKFALINLFSAFTWSISIMSLAYFFGESLINLLNFAKHNWYFIVPIIMLLLAAMLMIFKNIEKKLYKTNASKSQYQKISI
ncbi:MAG: DedA family protein [Campylobacteraceae bacterium]